MSVAAMHRLLATSLTAFLSCQLSHASVLVHGRSTGGLGFVNVHDTAGLSSLGLEPRSGYNAFVGLQPPPALRLGKRECLSNGSNYCFGNNVNFCADCGTCCVEGLYCCGKGGICCGKGCCASGQTCSEDGKCYSPANVVTALSTVYATSTYTEHQEATVFIVEVATSTILSTVETTIANAATQTDVHWVTATVTANPGPTVKLVKKGDRGYGNTDPSQPKKSFLDLFIARGLDFIHHAAALQRKEAVTVAPPAATAAASTVTGLTTRLSTITKHDVMSFTETSTSWVMSTIIETITKVLNAQTTVLVTSTLTVTSNQPTTRLIITTADPVSPATATASSTPTDLPEDTGDQAPAIPTPAIVGIAVGSAAAALILLIIAIFLIRRRRLRKTSPNFVISNSPPPPPTHMLTRQPTLPDLAQFATTAPAHHDAPVNLPKGYVTPQSSKGLFPGHQRSSSGFSTLIGTGTPNSKAAKAGDRRSGGFSSLSLGSGTALEQQQHNQNRSSSAAPAPVEVPGSQGHEWYEADGKPVVVVNTEPVSVAMPIQQASSSPHLPPSPSPPPSRTRTRPQVQRQGQSYYYYFPSPGQMMDQAGAVGTVLPGEVEGNNMGHGSPANQTSSPLGSGLMVGQAQNTTTGGGGGGSGLGAGTGSGSSSPGHHYVVAGQEGTASGGGQQQDGSYYHGQSQQQQQQQYFQVHSQDYAPQQQPQSQPQPQQSPQEQGNGNGNGNGEYHGGGGDQQQHQYQYQHQDQAQPQPQSQDQAQGQGQGQAQAQGQRQEQHQQQQQQQQQPNFQQYYYPGSS